MEHKKWYQSKTIWTAIFTVIVVILQQFDVELPNWLIPTLISAGLIFGRKSRLKIK